MGERTTGATPAQIEAAVAKWETCPEKDVPAFRRVVTGYAEDLVPPGSLIFGPEDIAALRYAITELRSRGNLLYVSIDDVDRLAALIGDDGNG
jgi:hypothetical protein